MKKTLILHIGMPKTGSTALQVFLSKHGKELKKKQIGYYKHLYRYTPWLTASNADFLLAQLLMELPEAEEGIKRDFLHNYPSLDIFRIRFTNKTKCQLEEEKEHFQKYIQSYQTIILSEEVIWHYHPFFKDYWSTLKRLCDAYFEDYDIKIMTYLRRQDLWFESKWKEDMRNEMPFPLDFEDALNVYDQIGYFDYETCIKEMEKVFGKQSIIIRNYDPSSMIRKNIISDFCAAIGIELNIPIPSDKKNISMSSEVAKAMCLINQGKTKSDNNLRATYYAISNELSQKFHSKRHLMNHEQRKKLLKKYESGNQYINQSYLSKNAQFTNKMPQSKSLSHNYLRDKLLSELIVFMAKNRIAKNK